VGVKLNSQDGCIRGGYRLILSKINFASKILFSLTATLTQVFQALCGDNPPALRLPFFKSYYRKELKI
jgi:hypothetical protein